LRLVRIENPQLVFIMETILKASEVEGIRSRMGFKNCLSEDCNGTGRERAGGLSLMWMEHVQFSISSYSLNHIHGECEDEETGEPWKLSCMYVFPEEQHKKKTWQLINSLARQGTGRWICCGDLNDILDSQEKKGGNVRSQMQVSYGRQIVVDWNLIDLGFEGYDFTWSNGREEEENIQCRIDKALANEEFINRFSPIKVSHLARFGSDHAAILISLEHTPPRDRRKKRIFRFEESWTKVANCEALVRHNRGRNPSNCVQKLDSLKQLGCAFGDHCLGEIKKEISRIEEMLKDPSLWSESMEDHMRYKSLEKEYGELLKRQETMWRQRSRAVWLKDGDGNTKFFHNKASQRAKVNHISKLKDEDGAWWKGEEQIERVLITYFDDLFSTSNPSNIEATCDVVKGKIFDEHKR